MVDEQDSPLPPAVSRASDDITVLGPELFINGDVISYKGENYYRACDYPVAQVGGSQTHCVKRVGHQSHIHEDYDGRTKVVSPESRPGGPVSEDESMLPKRGESNLVKHARRELELIDEEPEVIEWFLDVVRAFASFGHSGGSVEATLPVLTDLLRYKNLSPITDDPNEWHYYPADMWDGDQGIWQNIRYSKLFSRDGGKYYFNVDKPNETGISVSIEERKRHNRPGRKIELL